ncbi:zinc-dependent peptidase [Pantanalinema rosaneae CENA516]|uniref:M90 family metallopeptidase n=1 Tax=Pantanalinema rosaneae TaxID=1620701 RepID=UPI003D6F684F
MIPTILVLLVIGLIIGGIFLLPIAKQLRRDRWKQRPFPPSWTAILQQHLPFYDRLTPNEQRRLQGHIQIFLAEKQFIGCQGLQITEEIRLIIAGVACLLLLNEQGDYFPRLRSILVYPDAYLANQVNITDHYIVEEQQVARLGESWSRDLLILSWRQVQQDIANWQQGQNVILHEFAHQLDQADGNADGVPTLSDRVDYQQWASIMTSEYQRLCQEVKRGLRTVIDRYGTTNPAEFFAVVTETFFCQPRLLQRQHPQLYQLFQRYYQLSPEQWW